MNYLKNTIVEGIRDFLINKEFIYINEKKQKRIICKKAEKWDFVWEHSFNVEQIYLAIYKNDLFVGDGHVSTLLDNNNGEVLMSSENLGFNFRLYTSFTDFIVVQKEKSLLEVLFGIYNLKEQKLYFLKSDSYPFTVIKNVILGKGKYNIIRYDLDSKIEWNLNIEKIGDWYNDLDLKHEKGEILHIINIVNSILWIDIMAKTIIGIDITNGQMKYQLNKGIIQAGEGNEIPYFGKTTYEKQSNKLVGFYATQYWEVDLNTTIPELKIWNLDDLMKKYDATLPNFDVSGMNETHIFFGVGGIGKTPQILALNRQNFEIDWQYKFEGNIAYFSPTKVDINDKQLFVLDNEHTLHIFDKEVIN